MYSESSERRRENELMHRRSTHIIRFMGKAIKWCQCAREHQALSMLCDVCVRVCDGGFVVVVVVVVTIAEPFAVSQNAQHFS